MMMRIGKGECRRFSKLEGMDVGLGWVDCIEGFSLFALHLGGKASYGFMLSWRAVGLLTEYEG